MTTTIIKALKTYMKSSSQLASGASILTDFLGKNPKNYSIVPQPGAHVIEYNVDYSSEREYPFAIQSMESTADELTRIANSGFYEALADWFETQTQDGNMPTLNSNQYPIAIQATSWAFLSEQGESTTGVYQILCKLVYDQDAPT
jgi:hypothetical protein